MSSSKKVTGSVDVMKNLLNVLLVFIFSQVPSFAMLVEERPVDDFRRRLLDRVDLTNQVSAHLQKIEEEKYAAHFKKEDISSQEAKETISKIKYFSETIDRFSKNITAEQWEKIENADISKQKNLISQLIILSYCNILPLTTDLLT